MFLPQSALLSFEEITRLAHVFAQAGVRKLRLTGGEPLLRKNLEHLVGMLAALRTPDGQPLDLTLTTNGSLLTRKAAALKAAGLKRLTVSLDAIDDAVFRRMNDVGFAVEDVLSGIAAAVDAGFAPIKVNMVVKKGANDDQIVPLTLQAPCTRASATPSCCALSSSWMSAPPTAGAWTTCCPRTKCFRAPARRSAR